jgi:quinoprotein glucose dehydrogenase
VVSAPVQVLSVLALAGSIALCLSLGPADAVEPGKPEQPGKTGKPEQTGGAEAAQAAMKALRVPPGTGLKVELFAADPQLGSPVAICLDERNRVFVAEEYRFNRGTEENRSRPFLLEEDLKAQTLDDRLAMYRKHADKFEGGMSWFSRHADQVRLLEDRDGDGRADFSSVFAGGFNDPLDGLAAGVIARDGKVWLTCIPHLWRLEDKKGTGVADVREPLLRGFGVCNAFLGHDLHGLVWGPDGRLYFSVGDRGFHVVTKEGKTLHGPRVGGVFRCDPDGANLELIHRGLRNPQGLAFDQFGNLFADDNNCDKGDHSRLVYVVEGGDSGWNMAYQTVPAPYLTGPWHAERMWHLPHKEQPAWIVPPVGKIGAGPSGFCFTSGTSLPAEYRDRFLYCNYTGNGGVESFGVKPAGAGFEIVDHRDFLKPLMATDCQFGYDGKLYVSDFVGLDWGGKTKGGRIYTVFDPERLKDPVVEQTRKLFAEGFRQRPTEELKSLLTHPDMRVRQRAQFTLAERKDGEAVFASVAADEKADRFARLHAIWGLWQMGRTNASAAAPLVGRLADADAEVRAQAARVIGEVRVAEAAEALTARLKDPSPRVRFFAAVAIGRLGAKVTAGPLFELAKANADADPFLRHAAVQALASLGDPEAVQSRAKDPDPAVRRVVVLVQRRFGDERIAQFLSDADLSLAAEAARAINDLHMDAQTPALAATLSRLAAPPPGAEPLLRRAINAHFRLGGRENAEAVAAVVTNPRMPEAIRAEALAALGDWSSPSPRDRVTGFWRPLTPEKRDPAVVRGVLEPRVAELMSRTSGKLQTEAVKLVGRLGITVDDGAFATWVGDPARPAESRIAALRLLAGRKFAKLPELLDAALASAEPSLRAEARDVLAERDPARAADAFAAALRGSEVSVLERQRALAALPRLKVPAAGATLDEWAAALAEGNVPAELLLDTVEALRAAPSPSRTAAVKRFESSPAVAGRSAIFRASLHGGDAERGRTLFLGHAQAQCMRCHKIDGQGGDAGPDLTKVAARNAKDTREHLLESMLEPNAKIAHGYGTVSMLLSDGRVIAGTLKAETDEAVTVTLPDGKTETVAKADIEQRKPPVSAMPEMGKVLSPRELRDLVEFLSTLK